MMRAMPVTRLFRLPRESRRLLIRAAVTLTAASIAVSLLPFRTAIAFGATPLQRRSSLAPEQSVWAVEAAARRLPWRTVCIQRGLAVQRILRRAGVDAVLHYGARRVAETGKLESHVWVSVAGKTIIGGEDAVDFAEVAVFP